MDAKSLLRARKASTRVNHPYAVYNASGVLRCSVCAVPVKQWDAHLLTKQHRQSVQREKAEAAKLDAARETKRRAEEMAAEQDQPAKRTKLVEPEEEDDADESDGPQLPAGFFSSGNRPSVPDADDHGKADDEAGSLPVDKNAPSGDAELDDFLASLDHDDDDQAPAPTPSTGPSATRKRQTYKEDETEAVATYSAAPVRHVNGNGAEAEEPEQLEPEETEEERRTRLEREEREEIVSRLEEEERAQEDADARVIALKLRMEALKKKREMAKAGGSAAPVPKVKGKLPKASK